MKLIVSIVMVVMVCLAKRLKIVWKFVKFCENACEL